MLAPANDAPVDWDVIANIGKVLWGLSGVFALWVVSRLRRATAADQEQQVRAIVKDEIRGLDTSVAALETQVDGIERQVARLDVLIGEYKQNSDGIAESLERIQETANTTAGMVQLLVKQSNVSRI